MKRFSAPTWAFSVVGTVAALLLEPPFGLAQTSPLTLDAALAAAERESPRLAARRYAIDAAGDRARRAGELPDPKLRFGIDNLPVSNRGGDAFRWDTDFMTMRRIGVMQDVPNGDKRRARERRASAEREVESASLVGARAMLRRETAAAWFDVHYAERARGEIERLIADIELQREALAAAIAGGRASVAEPFMLGGTLEAVRERLIDQDRTIAKARAQLAAFIRDEARSALAPAPDTTRLPMPRERLLADLHVHSELASYHERIELARRELELERTTKKPDWSVEVSYGQRSSSFSNMVTLMFSIDLPFATGRRQDRDIAARAADVAQSEAMAEEARRMHEADVRSALADWDAAIARLDRYDAYVVPLARDRANAAIAAYRGGTGTLSPVIEARRAETEARVSRLVAEAERAKAWARLAYVLPGEGDR
jgi:outer membrane protein TolC